MEHYLTGSPPFLMPPYEPVSSTTSPSTSATLVAEIQRSALLLADGQSAEAVQRLEALSAAVPAYATSQVLLAKAYEAEQRWEDALEAWHRAHFLGPGSPLVQRERRRLLEAKAHAAEAASPPELPHWPAGLLPRNVSPRRFAGGGYRLSARRGIRVSRR